jgi:hypothetical protein
LCINDIWNRGNYSQFKKKQKENAIKIRNKKPQKEKSRKRKKRKSERRQAVSPMRPLNFFLEL